MKKIDTNVDKVKSEVYSLLNELQTCTVEKEELEQKYNYLFNISKTLFNLVIQESKNPNFNKTSFDKNLSHMLDNILKIQQNQITQHNASEDIGKLLAKQFIPQYK
jgi:hypothetical protein